MKPLEHIIDIILAVVVLFLFPILFFTQKQDALIKTIVTTDTKDFVEEARSRGYITSEMYDGYLQELSDTGLLYDISLEYRQQIYEPEYRFRTPEEIIEEQNAAYSGTNAYSFHPITTEIPVVTDPVITGTLNTDTNASVLASAVNTPASVGHLHTNACYIGVKHSHTPDCYTTTYHYHNSGCYSNSYHTHWYGCYTTHTHNSSCYSYSTCSNCGGSGMDYDSSPDDPENATCGTCSGSGRIKRLSCALSTSPILTCGKTVGQYEGNYISCGYSNGQITGSRLSCGKIENLYYNGNTQVYLSCSMQINSIAPTHINQTVYINDPLITTVYATYADGSTKVIVCTTTFSTSSIVQNQTVPLNYSYTIDGVTYTKTCTIVVNVVPRSKTCINGHTYNLNNDGTDPDCPYCRAWLSSLVVAVPTTGTITIYKGTTLQDNGVSLLAIYLDGRTEYLYTEFVDNLDKQYVGSQIVTLSYKGKNTTLNVTTKRNIVKCSVCDRFYELFPDDTNPGCPYCEALTPVFTGKILEYYNDTYQSEILKELYEGSGIYCFTRDDYLSITVTNKKQSLGQSVLSSLNMGTDSFIHAEYGGYIRESGSKYSSTNQYVYNPITTDIPTVTDPINTGSLNTETNESVLASSVNTPVSPGHIHTDACYLGHRHNENCIPVGDTSKKVTVFYYRDFNIDTSIESYGYTLWCDTYNKEILSVQYRYNNFFKPINTFISSYINYYTYNNSGSVVRKSFSDTYAPYNNADEAWHNEETNHINDRLFPYVASLPVATFYELGTDFNRTTKPIVWNYSPIEYLIKGDNLIHSIPWLGCPYCGVYGQNYSCGQVQDETPDCSKIVTSITPTHPLQTVAIGDPLITTMAAQFLDGSSHVVVGTSTFSTADIVKNQTATLTYTYTIDGVPYTKTGTIVVSVVPRSKTCVYGHTYNLNKDGSDPGCPYCKAWLRSLEIEIPSSKSITILKGTSLSENGVTLLATYLDGHKERLDTEYVDNLDMNYIGTQIVTLSYKGKYISLVVTTKRNN